MRDIADSPGDHRSVQPADPARDIAISFLRLSNLDSEMVDRLSRYESGLWRQLVQTTFALTLRRRLRQGL